MIDMLIIIFYWLSSIMLFIFSYIVLFREKVFMLNRIIAVKEKFKKSFGILYFIAAVIILWISIEMYINPIMKTSYSFLLATISIILNLFCRIRG